MAANSFFHRLEPTLALGILIAFFLPWIEGQVQLTGLELVSLAHGRQAEQAEAMLLVAFAAIPVLALLTLVAGAIRHAQRLLGGICAVVTLAGMILLWLARQQAEPDQGVLGYGAWLNGLFGLLLLLSALNVIRLPPPRSGLAERR